MTWKLDLAMVILILGGLFAVYMIDFSSDVIEDTTSTVETSTVLTTISTILETTIETTTSEQVVDTSIETTVETTVLEGNLFISGIELNGSDVTNEWVEITALGNNYDMSNYTLKDLINHTYIFSEFILDSENKVRVHTGIGVDNNTDLFWNRSSAVWNNGGDTATLANSLGIVDEKTCDSRTCWFTE
ncbi:hypothetical protein CL614_02015 [archaeon]|nr:hypothetical protein [archaeon]|tara:strand:- start:53 stop:616 length:564 start_codon:yes stop_codon:yes gene_type:complete